MARTGRPSDYDFNLCLEICEQVSLGNNIKDVLDSKEVYPSFPTFCKWKREHEELLNLYVNSIADKAEMVDAQIDEIWLGCKQGKYEPSVANVLIQTLKWKAAKYYPKMYGDNKNIDHTSKGEKLQTPILNIDPLNADE
jgi:hypothetical protein